MSVPVHSSWFQRKTGSHMPLATIILVLCALGIILFLIKKAPFIDDGMKTVIGWVALGCVVIWLVKITHLWHWLSTLTVG